MGVTVLGVGLDVVDVEAFAGQLADWASGFVEGVFTPAERRNLPVEDGPRVLHLAGRFAAKEAFVKAWSSARRGQVPIRASVPWQEVEVVEDGFGRPGLRLHGAVASACAELSGNGVESHLSISHDGPVAAAVVVLSAPA